MVQLRKTELNEFQSIYAAAVIALVELSRSIVDDIEDSWNTQRVLGDRTRLTGVSSMGNTVIQSPAGPPMAEKKESNVSDEVDEIQMVPRFQPDSSLL